MTSRSNRRRSRAWVAVAGAAAVVVVGGGGYALTQRDGGDVTTVAASTSPSPSASASSASPASPATSAASSAPEETPAPDGTSPAPRGTPRSTPAGSVATSAPAGAALPSGSATVPVYWLGGSSPKLFREYVRAGDAGADDATRALRAMLAGGPGDPDYTSPWSADPTATVTSTGGRLVVDLAASAAAGRAADATAAVQQLVYTVTAAAGSSDPVEIRVDGRPEPTLFGEAVARTVARAPQADVQAPAWITGVTPGSGSVTVTGVGTAFEGTLLYTITDASGAEVAREAVQAGANGTFDDFSFTAQVGPGTYTVAVVAPDESGGEGATPLADTKGFTVS
nr:Gmad2 immunoglobulin-like domain-containing protein [Kineococcus aurantiacus]